MNEHQDPFDILIETYMRDVDFSNWMLYTLYNRLKLFLKGDEMTDHGLTRDRARVIVKQLGLIVDEISQPVYGMERLGEHLKRRDDDE